MPVNEREFQGSNYGYVLELYDKFKRNPSSVDDATRALFREWTPGDTAVVTTPAAGAPTDLATAVRAVNLAQSIRRYGHLAAQIDPLGRRNVGDPALLPETHGVTDSDLRALP